MHSKKLAFPILSFSFALIGLVGCVPGSERAKAEKGVKEFHERFNKHAFTDIYKTADQSLKSKFSEEEFVSGLKAVREGHGAVQNSELVAIDYNYSPDLRMVKVFYRTEFEMGDAEEQFIFVIDDSGPHLKSYIFR